MIDKLDECFNHRLKHQDLFCNGCHDLLMQCVDIGNIAG